MSHNEPNMDDEKQRLIFTILQGFCTDDTDDSKEAVSPIFNHVKCSEILKHMFPLEGSHCTKECYIYDLLEDNIDDTDLLFLEGFVRGYSKITTSYDMNESVSNGEYKDYLLKVQELHFRALLEYKNILSHKLKKILIKLYKRYALINNLKKPLQSYIDDDKEQDKYLFEKLAEKYPIIEHTEEVNETFKYDKGIAEYFYAIYIANRLINQDDLTLICDDIKKDKKVIDALTIIETKYIPMKPNTKDAVKFALQTARSPEVKEKALNLQNINSLRFKTVPFSDKKDLIDQLYSLIIENVDTSDFLNNLLGGNCSNANKKKKYKETIDLDIKDYMPTIDELLTNQFNFSSSDEFLENTIIGRYINRFTNLETIRNTLSQMKESNYQLAEETKYTDDEMILEGNKLSENKIVKKSYKWKKFDRYLNPNHHRSIFNLKGRLKKNNDIKGGLEIKVLYKGNIVEGKLWRGPTNDSDDIWKQAIDKDDYSFAVSFESGPLLFPKDTLVHIPKLSSRGGRTRRKRRVNRGTRKK